MTPMFMTIDLGRMAYAPACELQSDYLNKVLARREEPSPDLNAAGTSHDTSGAPRHFGYLLLVEHDPPVITITRRPAAASHLLTLPDMLKREGIELAQTDRGGDITYHGPGQLVAYPILDLNLLKLRLHDYMRLLESAVMDTCESFGVTARRDACATGVWVGSGAIDTNGAEGASDAKICAMGVRVRRWISMHGLALNVTTNLDHFKHIVPCGLAGRRVTSLQEQLGEQCPSMQLVKHRLLVCLDDRLRQHVAQAADPHLSMTTALDSGGAPTRT
ncbi:MAG: lipoyl(octanoyl) transferase LipB [Pyrinomonadaceae bacterium]|nr:lipoyl(octanoyl) transferase LipB [Phycisphaerales bacterium]